MDGKLSKTKFVGQDRQDAARPTPIIVDAAMAQVIDASDVVSFDVFDTLFLRPLADPEDLFALLGERFSVPAFREMRRIAQATAFADMASRGASEITLADIYNCITGLPAGCKARQLRDAEIELELLLTVPNPRLVGLFRQLVAQKRVVLTTDMYLPESFFVQLLKRHQLPSVPLFVSSARNATKRDHGELFDIVVAELGVEPARILHIGDNAVSDVTRARERGLRSYHYRDPVLATPCELMAGRLPEPSSIAVALPRTRPMNGDTDPRYEFGFRYAGPAARGFLQWIRDRACSDRIDVLLFVSRDGFVLEDMAQRGDVDGLPRHAYLHGSRVAFSLAATMESNFDGQIDFLLSGADGLQPREVLERIGVTPPAESVMWDIALGADVVVNAASMPRMRSFLHSYRSQIVQICHRNRRGLYLLLRQLGVAPGMRVGMVDVGWNGSTQEAFARAIKRMIPVELMGYYLGLSDSDVCKRRRGELNMCAMLDAETIGGALARKLYEMRVAVELMFSAPHASVIGYDSDANNDVAPVLDEGRNTSQETGRTVDIVLQAAMDFSEDFNAVCDATGHRPQAMAIIAPLLAFVNNSSADDLRSLGALDNFDAWSSSRNTRTPIFGYGIP